jgi:flagellar hook protein FlgE
MALINSLNTGVAGIKTFSKSLEVIGDNIANVNTTGFKASRVTNKDNFSFTLNEGVAGGVNPMQTGNGSSVAGISQRFTQGVLSTTGGPTDLGIIGDGFFKITGHPDGDMFTRAGDFRLDKDGKLVTNQGYIVDGPTSDIPKDADSFNISKDGTVKSYKNGTATDHGQIKIYSFNNPNGLKREGDNLLSNRNTAAGTEQDVTADKTNEIIQGTLELSNVDLTQEFSDLIVAQRAFQSNSRVITVSDSVMEEVINLKR